LFKLFQRVPLFWLLQVLGWLAYVGIDSINLLIPFEGRRAVIISRAVLNSTLFFASLALRPIYRRMLGRNKTWPNAPWLHILLQVGLFSVALAVPCGLVTQWDWVVLKGSSGWLHFVVDAWSNILFASILLISWSALYFGIKHYQASQAAHERAVQAEGLAREARLEALRYQLNPHFLFNALNGISSLVVQGNSAAANRMLVQLASFLRLTLYGLDVQEIPLHQEIANTEHYLAIEKARLGDRLELEFAVAPEVQDALVPPLFLQPLVENAIRHGIAPNPTGGKLTIQAQWATGRVRVTVSNDSIDTQPHQNEPGTQRRRFGLSNTMERFRVLYGADHRLIVHRPPEGGCQVEIEFPYREESSVVPVTSGEEACAS
jgi:two-component system sensor histidine kinase AlgZ